MVKVALMVAGTVLSAQGGVAGQGSIPYVDALEKATVEQPNIDNIHKKALVIGNGDINAIVYSSKGHVL